MDPGMEVVLIAQRKGDPGSGKRVVVDNPTAELLEYFHAPATSRSDLTQREFDQLRQQMPPVTRNADASTEFRAQSPR